MLKFGIEERLSEIVDINSEINTLQLRKEIAHTINGGNTDSYSVWISLKLAREAGPLALLGFNLPSREEESARADLSIRRNSSESIDVLQREIEKLREKRESIFSELLRQQPESPMEILELKQRSHQLDLILAYSEKKVILQSFPFPYPGAYKRYITEKQKMFRSQQRLALYEGQINSNRGVSYKVEQLTKTIDNVINEANKGLSEVAEMRNQLSLTFRGSGVSCNSLFL